MSAFSEWTLNSNLVLMWLILLVIVLGLSRDRSAARTMCMKGAILSAMCATELLALFGADLQEEKAAFIHTCNCVMSHFDGSYFILNPLVA